MATTMRGRTGSRTRSASGRYGFATGRSDNVSGARNTGSRTPTTSSATQVDAKYRNVNHTFEGKISSFKMLFNQTRGAAKCPRPTTMTLNTFANWINKGAVVHTCTPAQVAKWARTTNWNFNARTPSVTACKNVLTGKFGKNTIKAVARTKTGSFMVATSPVWKGKDFSFPKGM